jgi:hypothetical protein
MRAHLGTRVDEGCCGVDEDVVRCQHCRHGC